MGTSESSISKCCGRTQPTQTDINTEIEQSMQKQIKHNKKPKKKKVINPKTNTANNQVTKNNNHQYIQTVEEVSITPGVSQQTNQNYNNVDNTDQSMTITDNNHDQNSTTKTPNISYQSLQSNQQQDTDDNYTDGISTTATYKNNQTPSSHISHKSHNSNQYEYIDDSMEDGTIDSEKIIQMTYDQSNTPVQIINNNDDDGITALPKSQSPVNNTRHVVTQSVFENNIELFVDNEWNHKELIQLIIYSENQNTNISDIDDDNNNDYDKINNDPILSIRHNDELECLKKLKDIITYHLNKDNIKPPPKHTVGVADIKAARTPSISSTSSGAGSGSGGDNDIVELTAEGSDDGYIDNANELYKSVLNEQTEMYLNGSSQLIIPQNAYKKLRETFMIEMFHGKKKAILLQNDLNEKIFNGYMIAPEIIKKNNSLPLQFKNFKRIYYNDVNDNNREYILNFQMIDNDGSNIFGIDLGIYAYNLYKYNRFNLLTKFPDNVQSLTDMYFSIYFNQKQTKLYILYGILQPLYKSDIQDAFNNLAIYNINDSKWNVLKNISDLSVTQQPPIIIITNDDQYFLFGAIFMKYNQNENKFIKFNAPKGYKSKDTISSASNINYFGFNSLYKTSQSTNIILCEKQERIYIFGGSDTADIYTDIWYLDINKFNYDDANNWELFKLLSIDTNIDKITIHKSMECILCFDYIILIFIQSELSNDDDDDDDDDDIDDDANIEYDTIYCLDVLQHKMLKGNYGLLGCEADIIITKNNEIHFLGGSHAKIDAFSLIPDGIIDFYRKRNANLICGYLRMHCKKGFTKSRNNDIKKVIYDYYPVL